MKTVLFFYAVTIFLIYLYYVISGISWPPTSRRSSSAGFRQNERRHSAGAELPERPPRSRRVSRRKMQSRCRTARLVEATFYEVLFKSYISFLYFSYFSFLQCLLHVHWTYQFKEAF